MEPRDYNAFGDKSRIVQYMDRSWLFTKWLAAIGGLIGCVLAYRACIPSPPEPLPPGTAACGMSFFADVIMKFFAATPVMPITTSLLGGCCGSFLHWVLYRRKYHLD